MQENIIKKGLMSFAFEKTPSISLGCKLVPVLHQEYENSLLLQKLRNSSCLMVWASGLTQNYLFLPGVQRVEETIHQIKHYPVETIVRFVDIYPLDSNLSSGERHSPLKQHLLGLGYCISYIILPPLLTWFLGFAFTPSRLRKSIYSRVWPLRVMSYLHHNLER